MKFTQTNERWENFVKYFQNHFNSRSADERKFVISESASFGKLFTHIFPSADKDFPCFDGEKTPRTTFMIYIQPINTD